MKKLISICFLFFFVVIGNAQVNKKPKWNELNQDQLSLALEHSSKNIKTGKILTFSGLGVASFGMVVGMAGVIETWDNPNSHDNTAAVGGIALVAGIITVYVGIPIWIVGATRKKNITLELVKYNPKGSASINGFGLKIRF